MVKLESEKMATESVTWLLPWMVLEYGFLYASILTWGALYGLLKTKSIADVVRDVLIIVVAVGSSHYGLASNHTVIGLLGLAAATGLSVMLHSSEFSKSNNMAPFGYLTSISIVSSLLVLSGILTSELS